MNDDGWRMVSKTAMIVQNIKHIEFNEDKNNVTPSKKMSIILDLLWEHTQKIGLRWKYTFFVETNQIAIYLFSCLIKVSLPWRWYLFVHIILVPSFWFGNPIVIFGYRSYFFDENFCKNFYFLPESAELSDSTTDRSALRRHSGRKNKCFHKKPTFGAS